MVQTARVARTHLRPARELHGEPSVRRRRDGPDHLPLLSALLALHVHAAAHARLLLRCVRCGCGCGHGCCWLATNSDGLGRTNGGGDRREGSGGLCIGWRGVFWRVDALNTRWANAISNQLGVEYVMRMDGMMRLREEEFIASHRRLRVLGVCLSGTLSGLEAGRFGVREQQSSGARAKSKPPLNRTLFTKSISFFQHASDSWVVDLFT